MKSISKVTLAILWLLNRKHSIAWRQGFGDAALRRGNLNPYRVDTKQYVEYEAGFEEAIARPE